MIIRSMTATDVDAVHLAGSTSKEFDVSNNAPAFWDKPTLERWCQSQDDLTLVAEDKGVLIGFALFACHRATNKVTWENVWVHFDRRNSGIARQLIERAHAMLHERGYFIVVALADIDSEEIRQALPRLGFKAGSSCVWFDRIL
jgi:predicted N-acetyltransferase YhbS